MRNKENETLMLVAIDFKKSSDSISRNKLMEAPVKYKINSK